MAAVWSLSLRPTAKSQPTARATSDNRRAKMRGTGGLEGANRRGWGRLASSHPVRSTSILVRHTNTIAMENFRLLTIPGYTSSGPRHWQSLWEQADSSMTRVEQEDWDNPDVETWSASIEAAVRKADRPVVLVAHSCGSTAVGHWAARNPTKIAGALLVAPPDTDRSDLDDPVKRFALHRLEPLPFPTLVVASEDDPYCTFDRARHLATAWGARLVSAGKAGHISTASGHGLWPEGKRLLKGFLGDIFSRRAGA